MIRKFIDARYQNARGLSSIDPEMTDVEVYCFVATKLTWAARAVLRRFPGRFLGPQVILRNRRRLILEPGVALGRGVTIDALAREGVVLRRNATVDVSAILRGSGGVRRVGRGIEIGPRAAIGASNFIHGGGGVRVGADVLLGPGVRIFSENHNFEEVDQPIIEQGETEGPIEIGDGSWLGAGVTVLAGVTIGRGVVVAAGSVVTSNVPDNCVAAGAPAKVVKSRVPGVASSSSPRKG